ncbi:MAG TPA: pitrilysin family protein [Thermoanaerobaculia bacterium]|nr:pitrilysin family protein [Thermoanaerobaculia bacterium]
MTRPTFVEQVTRRKLSNGAELFVLENHFNPTVAVSGSFYAGPLFAPPDRRAIASMTAGELTKGTELRNKLQLAEDLESRGASLSISADASDPVGADIAGASLSRDVDLLLDRLIEVLRKPVFPQDELDKEKKRLVGAIRQQQDQTSVRAQETAARRIYPPGHPFHRRTGDERIARIESMTRADLQAFYEARYGAETLRLVVVGDVDSERILDFLERKIGDWKPGPAEEFPAIAIPQAVPRSETVEMPDKANADVVLALPGSLTRTDPSYLACVLANSALGQSSLSSRLGVRVRDVEGLTYGIHSSFHATHVPGPYVVSVTVKPEMRDAAVASTLDEIRKFLREGMTEKELADEKSSRIGKFKVDLASNAGIAQAIDAAIYYRLGLPYLDDFAARVSAVTREQANEAISRLVHPDAFTIVSAGTFSKIAG